MRLLTYLAKGNKARDILSVLALELFLQAFELNLQ